MFLPRRDWRFLPANCLIRDDMEFSGEDAEIGGGYHWIDPTIDLELRKLAGVEPVSELLTEEDSKVSGHIKVHETLTRLQDLLRNPIFHEALWRLVQDEHGEEFAGELIQTDELVLSLYESIKVKYSVHGQPLGVKLRRWKRYKNEIKLATGPLGLPLAQAINDWLPKTHQLIHRLENFGELFLLEPSEISSFLKTLSLKNYNDSDAARLAPQAIQVELDVDALTDDDASEVDQTAVPELWGTKLAIHAAELPNAYASSVSQPKRISAYNSDNGHDYDDPYDDFHDPYSFDDEEETTNGRPPLLTGGTHTKAYGPSGGGSPVLVGNLEFAMRQHARFSDIPSALLGEIMDYERKHDRVPERIPDGPLHIISKSEKETRHILIRASTRAWEDHPVYIDGKMLAIAQEHRDSFWLYVLEHVADVNRIRLNPVFNVANQVEPVLQQLLNRLVVPSDFRQQSNESIELELRPTLNAGILYESSPARIGRIIELKETDEGPEVTFELTPFDDSQTETRIWSGEKIYSSEMFDNRGNNEVD